MPAASLFGWISLRPGQLEAMEAAVNGRDVLCVMPTSSGKSAISQVPGMLLPWVAIVASPLIALQRSVVNVLSWGTPPLPHQSWKKPGPRLRKATMGIDKPKVR